jgi:hypothetical protein
MRAKPADIESWEPGTPRGKIMMRLLPAIAMQVFLVVCQLLLATPSPAQYVFLDVNGDGLCGGSDVLTNDINAVDIYFDTNHNADGSKKIIV